MNKCIFMGRLTKEPEIRYSAGENPTAVARYTLAVERKYKKDGQQPADFLNMVAFGKTAEFAEKYLTKGMKVAVVAQAQSGSYTKKDGTKAYTTEFVVSEHYFTEKKTERQQTGQESNDFIDVPEDIQEELPFA
jgi:single-strand DNA-binding protein